VLTARDFVEARLYESEGEVIQDALRHLLAGVSWAQMRDILMERGILPRQGPESLQEAEADIQALRDHIQTQS
jgi:Arc/MetJ-type ribon-helix-helix transcriptional regulator